jgi:hypothetical protein
MTGSPRLAHLVRVAGRLPMRVVARKLLKLAGGRLMGLGRGLGRHVRCSYPAAMGAPLPRLGPLDRRLLAPLAPLLDRLCRHYQSNRFNLLGSGWVEATAEPFAFPGPDGRRARAIRALIQDPAYRCVAWHRDIKSGHGWNPHVWGSAIAYGHAPGVDVKLPWELARMHHLVHLAQQYGVTCDAGWADLARHHILDFWAANPPGWGVNWACAMDVAIRGANVALAWDLFKALGHRFDAAFEAELAALLLAHGRFVAANPEWHGGNRANHYLADMAGLAVIASHLAPTPETKGWLAMAQAALESECLYQFLGDGGNFESSTAYHRLSAELALYGAASLAGLGRPLSRPALDRLRAAMDFAAAVMMPSGRAVQIGDNDSGRFFKLSPRWDDEAERHLDFTHLGAAATGLFGPHWPVAPDQAAEAAVVAALAGTTTLSSAPSVATEIAAAAPPDLAGPCRRLVILPPDPAALDGLRTAAYPDFGLYLWRGPRCFIAVRCGAVHHGAHAHNDQLAVEIEIDGEAWAQDPGSYLYTPDLAARDRYRSVMAHFAPRAGDKEPGRLVAPFRLDDRCKARVLRFGADFVGEHQGFGHRVQRRVAVGKGRIVIEDWPGQGEIRLTDPQGLARLLGLKLPYSPGYGEVEENRLLSRR